MGEHCHRCGEELSPAPGSTFCPHCGAPQLYLRDYTPSDPGPIDGVAAPPPPPDPRQIEWRTAIRCALLVALGAAILVGLQSLVPWLTLLSWLWIVSGSVLALGIYQKQQPAAWMDARVGARIGLLVGVALTAGLGLGSAVMGVAGRFLLHNMASVDVANRLLMDNLRVQMAQSSTPTPIPANVLGLMSSPEFFAGVVLLGFAMVSVILILLSTVGGAFAGMMRLRASRQA